MADGTAGTASRNPGRILVDHEPIAHQHARGIAPVEPVTVVLKHAAEIDAKGNVTRVTHQMAITVRRQMDARLWSKFDGQQERAAQELYDAWRGIVRAVDVHISRYDDSPSRWDGNVSAYQADCRITYQRWVVWCQDKGISHQAAVEIIGEGKTAAEVERTRKRRHGWAVENLLNALDEWCQLRGYKTDPTRGGRAKS